MSYQYFQRRSLIALALFAIFPAVCAANEDLADSFQNLIARYINLARLQDHKALLASDLSLRLTHDLRQEHVERTSTVKTVEEILSLYPVLSSQNQRYMAYQVLALGNLFLDGSPIIKPEASQRAYSEIKSDKFIDADLGNKLVDCVVQAAKIGKWPADESLTVALNAVASNKKLRPELRTDIQSTQRSVASGPTNYDVRPIIANLKSITDANWAGAPEFQMPLPWKKYPLSWEKFVPVQPADTPPEERRATMAHTMIIKEFSRPTAKQIHESVEQLRKIYPTLSEFDQHDVCTSILDVTQKLLRTNLNSDADSLFWLVFPSVKTGWLDNGSVSSSLMFNNSYYEQAFKLPASIAIVQKTIAFETAGNYNQASEINLRTVLGDVYDMNKERRKATEQYMLIERLNEELHQKGFFDAQSYDMYKDQMKERLREK